MNRHSVASGTPWKVRRAHIQGEPFHRPSTSTFISSTKGETLSQISFSTSSQVLPAFIVTHFSPYVPFPILPNVSRTTRTCVSTFAQRSSSYPLRCFAAYSGAIPRKRVKLGAGRDTSGAQHHSYVQGLKVVKEGIRCNTFDAENAVPGDAYSSQITVVPD